MKNLTEEEKIIIKDILADKLILGLDLDEIKDDSRIKEDLGADSLDEVEIIMEIESRFNCTIPDAIAEEIKTVSDYFNFLPDYI